MPEDMEDEEDEEDNDANEANEDSGWDCVVVVALVTDEFEVVFVFVVGDGDGDGDGKEDGLFLSRWWRRLDFQIIKASVDTAAAAAAVAVATNGHLYRRRNGVDIDVWEAKESSVIGG